MFWYVLGKRNDECLTKYWGTRKDSNLEGRSAVYVDKPFHGEHLLGAIEQDERLERMPDEKNSGKEKVFVG